MNGYSYEAKCARYLSCLGFRHVEMTPQSGDQGVDLLAVRHGKRYAVQCKYYRNPVGNHAVMEAFAGAKYYDCDKAIVMTNNSFTAAATKLSAQTGVILWPECRARTGLWGRFSPLFTCISFLLSLVCAALVIQGLFHGEASSLTLPRAGQMIASLLAAAIQLLPMKNRWSALLTALLQAAVLRLVLLQPFPPPWSLTDHQLLMLLIAALIAAVLRWLCSISVRPIPKAVRTQL